MKDRIIINGTGMHFFLNDQEVDEATYRLVYPPIVADYNPAFDPKHCNAWPMLSDALAVHPSQIPAMMERAAKMGVPTEFNAEDGRVILRDRDHRRRYAKLVESSNDGSVHAFDRDGGYSDAQQ